ncbi:hypothetical protein LTR22_002756 [Elasticomyces elasticus]|nr:hypothetical protein LTR22_002756 [Elasticomyces elasticus]
MAAQITSLPHEVSDLALKSLGPIDILSLRSTSKHFELATLDWFRKWCMVRRIHLWTRHGLQSLVDITNPDRGLLHSLEHISIVVQTVRQPPARPGSSGASYRGSNALLHHYRQQRWINWQQLMIPDDETGLNELMTIFHNIKWAQDKNRARRSITITITTHPIYPGPLGRTYGTRTLLNRLGHKIDPSHLKDGNNIEKSYYTGLQEPQTFSSLRDGSSVCWETLTSFSLTLRPPRVVRSARERDACLEGLAQFMRAAKNLERLEIHEPCLEPAEADDFRQARARDIWKGIPDAVMALQLKHLVFQNTADPAGTYIKMLWYQRNSIRSLKFVPAVQSEGNGWYRLFTVLLETPNLDTLEMKSLSLENGNVGNVTGTGRDVIKEGLQRAITNGVVARPRATAT